mmetsp:Transcript_31103/g.47193  ORF Transcript_31103/g.47193 Transcript_31103/m.47193 type:complete len:636 (+) Transcript_31103:60-1967(+)
MGEAAEDTMKVPSTPAPPTVAVIGCGPGGMFFLHAIEMRRREMEEKGDLEGLASLPIVTCFERASVPGGVWRAKSTDGNPEQTDTTNMYEALWTNGPKEDIEFPDYTYDDHFHQPLPVYMPRQPLLDYMLCRVTRNCPHFFDAVRFNTNVTSVKWDEEKSKFVVATSNHETKEELTETFDKCIWAAGQNGKPSFPMSIKRLLKRGGFKGKCIHSSECEDFKTDVEGKRVVFIGDEYSAEDLALQAIKLGVEKVFICSRRGWGVATYTSAWPMKKVEACECMLPTEVIQDGRGLRLTEVYPDIETEEYEFANDRDTKDLLDIETVVFCTGYKPNLSMIEASMRPSFCNVPFETEEVLPENWTMTPNPSSEHLGHVLPSEELYTTYVDPLLYRNTLISNPNMMYLFSNAHYPLKDIDVMAWLCLSYITGDAKLPSAEEMQRRNKLDILEEMDDFISRADCDFCYFAAYDDFFDKKIIEEGKSWKDPNGEEYNLISMRLGARFMARSMQDGGYPEDIGNFTKLNEKGERMVQMNFLSGLARGTLDPDSEDSKWRTFRDHDTNGFYSLQTGTPSVPLKDRWLDLDEKDCGVTDCAETVPPSIFDKKVSQLPSLDLKKDEEGPNLTDISDLSSMDSREES